MLQLYGKIENVWLDVTYILDYCQPRSGLPRTWRQIIRNWQEEGYANLRLCRLRSDLRGYEEVAPQEIVAPPAGASGMAAPSIGWRGRAKQNLRRLGRFVRACVPPLLYPPLRRLAYRALGTVRHLRAACGDYIRFRQRPTPLHLPPAWSARDLLIVLGASWDVPGTSETVWQLKRQFGFSLVSFFYDMIPFFAPQFFGTGVPAPPTNWQANMLWASDLAVTISEHSRADLRKFCALAEVPCPPVEIVRLGEDISIEADSSIEHPVAEVAPDEPFVLAVATIEVRKNHLLLYHVWRRLAEEFGDRLPRLVLVGSPGGLINDFLHLVRTDPHTREKVLILSGIKDEQLRWLYRHCLFTMYPSFYEGWGLPIAESLNYGKYCIASNSSSMPEIGGDLVGMHDPCDWKACIELVRPALFDAAFRARREQEIRTRYRQTRWQDCAAQLRGHIEKHFGPVFRRKEGEDAAVASAPVGDVSDRAVHPRRSA